MKIGHLSIYPNHLSGKDYTQGGVSSYTKNLITTFSKKYDDEIIILANVLDKRTSYIEDNVHVIRCWKKNILFIFEVYINVIRQRINVFHIQQELGLYGGYINALLLSILIALLRISQIKVVSTLHGVVDLKKVDYSFVKDNHSKLYPFLVRFGLKIIFSPIVWFSNKVIVHESIFKDFLVDNYYFIDDSKIEIIPHGVLDLSKLDYNNSKDILKIEKSRKVILFLGYLTGYKGLEILLGAYSKFNERDNIYLLICAGEHPKLKNDENYIENVYNRHKDIASKTLNPKNYRWVGYVPDSLVSLYYSAADLVVFPYTIAMSSSGPMAMSIGYEVPFIASTVFEYFIENKNLLFTLNEEDLARKLSFVINNTTEFNQLIKELKNKLIWENIVPKYNNLYKNL